MKMPGDKKAVITHRMQQSDKEVERLKDVLRDIREIAENPNAGELGLYASFGEISDIVDKELWPR